jgi:hypothetical protein
MLCWMCCACKLHRPSGSVGLDGGYDFVNATTADIKSPRAKEFMLEKGQLAVREQMNSTLQT